MAMNIEQAAKSAKQHCACRLRCWLASSPLSWLTAWPSLVTISGWCSRWRHCATDRAGSANQPTFHWHHTYQPATSDHLTPTGWTNHQPGLLSVNDASVTTRHASGTLFRRLSDPLTVMTASRPGYRLICLNDCFKTRLQTHLFDTVWRWRT